MKLKITKTNALEGIVNISGSKNATLPIIVASLLTDEEVILLNIPNITDVNNLLNILKYLNVDIKYDSVNKSVVIKRNNNLKDTLDINEVCKMRASYYLMGAYVGLNRNFKTYYPGGCSFTKRPIDYHLDAFKKMGYIIKEEDEYLYFIKQTNRNYKTEYTLEQKSLGTTINIILASVIGKHISIIKNPSIEPEVLELITFLNKMNANIKLIDNKIYIYGVEKLIGITHKIMSDRIEAGSYMLLASCVEKSNVLIKDIEPAYLEEPIKVLTLMGLDIKVFEDSILINKNKPLKERDLTIDAYPFFPTDLQQLYSVLATTTLGITYIKDLVYPTRISHLKEINKAKGLTDFKDGYIKIMPCNLKGTTLEAHDLRCGFACIMIGAISEGVTYVENVEVILRGYEDLIDKLNNIGLLLTVEE